ncbi:hypothetical protein SAMN00768000_1053 [Sulfobacillus thermosulfidooxidans DSM 9293]|uniref:Uncharacterized protein n=1 Tax=Sulfobacillus thermosulfidooxidans (strain DSM 9293 / VKM B-1269 / AT-1) TaxID=929705 RepID=A0A1W1WAS1_SULTA|nr:hypothetical protein SAMN00768000_1053 [Sulfobacillus thermosulfidooxidans DSM 9293]
MSFGQLIWSFVEVNVLRTFLTPTGIVPPRYRGGISFCPLPHAVEPEEYGAYR